MSLGSDEKWNRLKAKRGQHGKHNSPHNDKLGIWKAADSKSKNAANQSAIGRQLLFGLVSDYRRLGQVTVNVVCKGLDIRSKFTRLFSRNQFGFSDRSKGEEI